MQIALVHYDFMHCSAAKTLSTLEVTNIESLYRVFKKTFVIVQLCSCNGVVVDRLTDRQASNYNHGQPKKHNIYLFDSDDMVIVFFNKVYKNDPSLIEA